MGSCLWVGGHLLALPRSLSTTGPVPPPTPVCPRCTSKLTEWTRACPRLSPYCPRRPLSPHGGRGLRGKLTEALGLGLA